MVVEILLTPVVTSISTLSELELPWGLALKINLNADLWEEKEESIYPVILQFLGQFQQYR